MSIGEAPLALRHSASTSKIAIWRAVPAENALKAAPVLEFAQ